MVRCGRNPRGEAAGTWLECVGVEEGGEGGLELQGKSSNSTMQRFSLRKHLSWGGMKESKREATAGSVARCINSKHSSWTISNAGNSTKRCSLHSPQGIVQKWNLIWVTGFWSNWDLVGKPDVHSAWNFINVRCSNTCHAFSLICSTAFHSTKPFLLSGGKHLIYGWSRNYRHGQILWVSCEVKDPFDKDAYFHLSFSIGEVNGTHSLWVTGQSAETWGVHCVSTIKCPTLLDKANLGSMGRDREGLAGGLGLLLGLCEGEGIT